MNHKVLNTFLDKELDIVFVSGSSYPSDNVERVKKLEQAGFIKADENLSTLEEPVTQIEEKPTVKRTRKKASE